MTREQMIAWLTLEGWRFYPEGGGYAWALRRGETQITDQDTAYVDEALYVHNAQRAEYEKNSCIDPFRELGTWDEASDIVVCLAYEKLSSQMP